MPGPPSHPVTARPGKARAGGARRTVALVVTLLVAAATACTLPAGDRELKGDGAQQLTADGPVSMAVDGVNDFGADLWQRLAAEPTTANLVVSPPAVALALGMVGLGAGGGTADEFAAALHVDSPDALPVEHNLVSRYLAGQAGEQRSAYRKGVVQVRADAALWAQVGTQLDEGYLDRLAGTYGLGVRVADFRSDPAGARDALRLRAGEDLPEAPAGLVDAVPVDESTKLLSLSAGSLHAPWEVPFSPDGTADASFRSGDGTTVTVPTMTLNADGEVRSGSGDGWEAVELPYLGGTTALLVVVPSSGSVAELAASLDADGVQAIAQALRVEQVEVRLPRFAVSSQLALGPEVAALADGSVFDPTTADLSAMTAADGISLGPVGHGATLRIDEEGSDAAVTSVGTSATVAPAPHKIVVDRPFFFAVRDKPSGLIELVGWVSDPTADA